MTLVVVLLFGLGSVLIWSSVSTDPATGKSVSVLQTIADVWNNKLDVSTGGTITGRPTTPKTGDVYVPLSPSTSTLTPTLAGQSYQNASVANYLKNRQS